MFANDDPTFETWAKLDQNYIKDYDSTGIYQCYCLALKEEKNIKTSETCDEYKNEYYGGTSMVINISIGGFIGISNFVVTKIIGLVIPRLGC